MKENEDNRRKGKRRKESLTFTIINIFMNRPQVETF